MSVSQKLSPMRLSREKSGSYTVWMLHTHQAVNDKGVFVCLLVTERQWVLRFTDKALAWLQSMVRI